MNNDTLTTVLGIAASASGLAAQQGLAPNWTGPIAALLVALLGYYSNKPAQAK